MTSTVDITAIVPVSERHDDVRSLYAEYRDALDSYGSKYEFVFVLDGHFPEVLEQLKQLKEQGEPLRIIKLAKWFGEATALTAGFESSSSNVILTLPAYYQVEPTEIPKVLAELHNHDMVIGRRYPRVDSRFNRLQTRIFHGIVNFITGSSFTDLGLPSYHCMVISIVSCRYLRPGSVSELERSTLRNHPRRNSGGFIT
jgi:glycosyltransferase involved in cell wall biosynthesis